MRKIYAGLVGFVAGVVVLPLVAVAFPFVLAWWLYNEEDEDAVIQGI